MIFTFRFFFLLVKEDFNFLCVIYNLYGYDRLSRLYFNGPFGQVASFFKYIYQLSREVGHIHVLLFSNSVVIMQLCQIIYVLSFLHCACKNSLVDFYIWSLTIKWVFWTFSFILYCNSITVE